MNRIMRGMLQISLMFLAGRLLFGFYLGESLAALFLVSLFFCGTIAGTNRISPLKTMIRRKKAVIRKKEKAVRVDFQPFLICLVPRMVFKPF